MKAEVRGRARDWRVLYDDEAALATPFPVYDREGILTGVVMGGAPSDKGGMTESRAEFASAEEACEYARYLGASEVRVVRKMTRDEALAKARATRKDNA